MIKQIMIPIALITVGVGVGQLSRQHATADKYDTYGDKPYIPGCNWDGSKFLCQKYAYNYVAMDRLGTVTINPRKKR